MVLDRTDRRDDPVGAGDLLLVEVDVEAVLGELPRRGDGRLDLGLDLDPGLVQQVQDLPGTVGGVPVDRSPARVPVGVGVVGGGVGGGEVGDEGGDGFGVAGVPGGDRGRGDDLAVRIDGEVAFIAVEPAVAG